MLMRKSCIVLKGFQNSKLGELGIKLTFGIGLYSVLKVRLGLKGSESESMSTYCKSLFGKQKGNAGRYLEVLLAFRMHLPSRNAKSRGQKGFFSVRIFDTFNISVLLPSSPEHGWSVRMKCGGPCSQDGLRWRLEH